MDFYDLVRLMAALRAPEGCPWDRAQRIYDLRPYVMEEALELIEAIDSKDDDKIREELGDLLFEIIFVARIKEEEGAFTVDNAIGDIGAKMIERHPHVFGNKRLSTPAEVEGSWEKIKAKKKHAASILDGVTENLPALVIAQKYGQRASRVGFDWDDVSGVLSKIEEEISELKEALRDKNVPGAEEEIGDILFSVSNLARFLKVSPELALRKSNRKFSQRFRWVEEAAKREGRTLAQMSIDDLERLWQQAKSAHPVGGNR